jgi:hypothetical protein
MHAAESNPIDAKTPTPNRIEDHPTPTSDRPTYPFLLRVARGGRRCRRCGVAVSHLVGLGWTADRSVRRRAVVAEEAAEP